MTFDLPVVSTVQQSESNNGDSFGNNSDSCATIKVGSEGLEIPAQGLGYTGMSAVYGLSKHEPGMIDLIHNASGSGVTFFDTSDAYELHVNKIPLGKVSGPFPLFLFFRSRTHDRVLICTQGV
ncbi:hypothetical protein HPP92_002557 [Vanilla planifolia]|uniref:Uncharacterized protein n=1 Tax=Vanilla planifolia TaxID=51239 RepID=A0A835S8R9_VANPL|nr:hypothetical protein HPP92_002557 [Vanilla planifolia]